MNRPREKTPNPVIAIGAFLIVVTVLATGANLVAHSLQAIANYYAEPERVCRNEFGHKCDE